MIVCIPVIRTSDDPARNICTLVIKVPLQAAVLSDCFNYRNSINRLRADHQHSSFVVGPLCRLQGGYVLAIF